MKTQRKIKLSNQEGLLLKEIQVTEEFNLYFQSITLSLGSPDSSESLSEADLIKSIVNKYKNHTSVKKIKGKYITINSFSFQSVVSKDVLDVISTSDDTKSSGGDIFINDLIVYIEKMTFAVLQMIILSTNLVQT